MQISAEQRWFWPGHCPDAVASWFHDGDLSAAESPTAHVDRYFLQDCGSELSIKISDDDPRNMEIKGLIARYPRNSVEVWAKWKCNAVPGGECTEMHRSRWARLYALEAGRCEIPLDSETGVDAGDVLPQSCEVELSKITVEGCSDQWWTLGFEAYGDIVSAPLALTRALDLLQPPLPEGRMLNYPQFLVAALDRPSAPRERMPLAV